MVPTCDGKRNRAGAEWAEARIKQLTGGDMVRARFMGCDEFEFRPQFKLMIVGNHRPRLRDVGDAMRRRLRMVSFEFKPDVINRNLEDELLINEGGCILSWMIEGCLDWQKEGLPVPPAVQAATDDYFESQDTVTDWMNIACDLHSRYSEASGELFQSWSEYCRNTGDDPGSIVGFADALKRCGLRKKRTTGGARCWLGIRLKQPATGGR